MSDSGDDILRFWVFLGVLALLCIGVLYAIGSSDKPYQQVIEQEVDLEAVSTGS